jgi:MerR family transcriptional regulator/heat shock protein HspR
VIRPSLVRVPAMTRRIIPRDQVAHELSVSPNVLVRYEAMGWIQSVRVGGEVGYEPAQIRRLWTIVSFQRDLGINRAGVEVILHLQDHVLEVHRRMHDLADQLRELIDTDNPPSGRDSDD